ncbi:MAG TPA: serine/threonine-protein kinase [Victivallales bacterium]|nr:serine/threonine-protein kinase [Victivallales bacterium]HPO89495.1 serine/threonine-protein kinase [Victivallales bacterium]HRR05769.1 serine/threonine-protein kinase [Victivallales bacterium]HRR29487.1 serine/threonine-protein kinase [Victivallales bacterium]HRU00895.1 serine/threonine-protein kinase [Victivallales bacterium]
MKFNPINSAQKLFGIKSKSDENNKTILQENSDEKSTVILSVPPQSSSVPQIQFPTVIKQKYTIKKLIGRGAFGTVYLAEDNKIGRLVAIKQLEKKEDKHGIEIYERFMLEAKIGAQLDHPNIINVFGLEEDKKSACIIMEYLPGGSLATKIANSDLTLKSSINIMKGILSGLEAAHQITVTHRDIKPQNILFDGKDQPKISDFGIAILPFTFDKTLNSNQLNQRNILVGTPLYMAPEQLFSKEVDARADIYSAGVVFYEMLSGGKHILGIDTNVTFDEMKKIIKTQKTVPLTQEIPKEISEFIKKMTQKRPSERFQTTSEALSQLEIISKKLFPEESKNNTSPTSSPHAMLEDVIRLFLIDGNMSPAERRELLRRAERLGISQQQARILEEKVRSELSLPSLEDIENYQEAVEAALEKSSDLSLNSEQIVKLEDMRKNAGIKEDDAEEILQMIINKLEYKRRMLSAKFKV